MWFALFIVSFFQNTTIELLHSFATAKEKEWAGHLTGAAETGGEAIQETLEVLGQGHGLAILMEMLWWVIIHRRAAPSKDCKYDSLLSHFWINLDMKWHKGNSNWFTTIIKRFEGVLKLCLHFTYQAFILSILANHMEDLFVKEEMVALTEMGDKAKVEKEVALEEATVVEVEKISQAGIK